MAQDEAQRARIWKGRKAAFAAMGRVSPNYYVQDGVVPRTKLPEVLGRIRALEARSGLPIGNVFHAGDGNLHPLICYDERIPGQATLAEEVAGEILTYCVEAGGSITGEHGVGADKRDSMPRMFSDDDLDVMQQVRDALDPQRLCNPGKVLPTPRLCGEVPGPYRQHPVERAGLASDSDDRRRLDAAGQHGRRNRWRRAATRRRARDASDLAATLAAPRRATVWHGAPRWRHEARVGPPAVADRSRGEHARAQHVCSCIAHGDLTATAHAGVHAGASQSGARPHGQWLPIDSAFDEATIGGIVATNDSGPLRHRYGTPRDLLIGVTLAMADGRLVKAGGHRREERRRL